MHEVFVSYAIADVHVYLVDVLQQVHLLYESSRIC